MTSKVTAWRQTSEKGALSRATTRARQRAATRLAAEYPDRYNALVAEELSREPGADSQVAEPAPPAPLVDGVEQ